MDEPEINTRSRSPFENEATSEASTQQDGKEAVVLVKERDTNGVQEADSENEAMPVREGNQAEEEKEMRFLVEEGNARAESGEVGLGDESIAGEGNHGEVVGDEVPPGSTQPEGAIEQPDTTTESETGSDSGTYKLFPWEDPESRDFDWKKALTFPFLTEKTMDALDEYLKVNHNDGRDLVYLIDEGSITPDFCWFILSLADDGDCGYWKPWGRTTVYYYHPTFHPIINRFIRFFINRVSPYFSDRLHIDFPQDSEFSDGDPRVILFESFMLLGDLENLGTRARNGLMRPAQSKLLRLLCRIVMREWSILMKRPLAKANDSEKEKALKALFISARQFLCSIEMFFSRIRSERLELLLMKYLAEDGINRDVVRGLKKEQRKLEVERFRNAGRIYREPEDDGSLLPLDQVELIDRKNCEAQLDFLVWLEFSQGRLH